MSSFSGFSPYLCCCLMSCCAVLCCASFRLKSFSIPTASFALFEFHRGGMGITRVKAHSTMSRNQCWVPSFHSLPLQCCEEAIMLINRNSGTAVAAQEISPSSLTIAMGQGCEARSPVGRLSSSPMKEPFCAVQENRPSFVPLLASHVRGAPHIILAWPCPPSPIGQGCE